MKDPNPIKHADLYWLGLVLSVLFGGGHKIFAANFHRTGFLRVRVTRSRVDGMRYSTQHDIPVGAVRNHDTRAIVQQLVVDDPKAYRVILAENDILQGLDGS